MTNINWDEYLKKEEIERARTSSQFYTPRERKIIEVIVKEKELSSVPFKVTEYDRKFYNKRKEEYKEMKKVNPKKECFFAFSASSGD